jgi:acyl phosphate:glycerol-3-phosphate acyltransferase
MNGVDLAFGAVAYLIGSVSFAVVVSKAMGLPDPSSYGSGNPGATNVLRTGNKKAALLTLLGDFLKGVLAVMLVHAFGAPFGATDWALALAMLGAFLGHCLPLFHGFKGGKGVATAGGVVLAVNAALGGLMVLVWLAVAVLSRMSSLASIIAALAAPPLALWWIGNGPVAWMLALLAVILIVRHRANISKILAGTEGKIGEKKV